MFIVENAILTHRDKVQAWTEARDKWVNDANEYDYRTPRHYEDRHPRPGTTFKNVLRIAAGILGVLVIVSIVTGLVFGLNHPSSTHSRSKTSTSQTTQNEGAFRVGDTVQVVYGDYKDSVGVIVKDDDNGTIIKLTNSTLTRAECVAESSCDSGGGTDNGQLLGISTDKNLVPYKKVK